MKIHSWHWFPLLLLSALVALSIHDAAQANLEPDKLKHTVGEWKISTARWVRGCLAELTYDKGTESYISIGGETRTNMYFLVTISPKTVGRKRADEFLDTLRNPEIVLRHDRYSAEAWSYRDAVGVIIEGLPTAFIDELFQTKQLKYTENGYEKLSVMLDRVRDALPLLVSCIEQEGVQ